MTPAMMRRLHFGLMLFWLFVGTPVAIYFRNSIAFLVAISVYAIVVGHWSGWSAERPSEIVDDV